MYALDDKLRAVKLFNETKSFAVVKRMLGYPNQDDALRKWVKNYQVDHVINVKNIQMKKWSLQSNIIRNVRVLQLLLKIQDIPKQQIYCMVG